MADLGTVTGSTVPGVAWFQDVNDALYRSKVLNANYINVKDATYGAKGDGVTNDTTAIQAALNAAAMASIAPEGTSGDWYVKIPHGRYLVTQLEVPIRCNIIFEGGVLAPYNVVTSYAYMLKFLGHNNVYNLTIDANYATNYTTIGWVRSRYNTFTNSEIWRAKLAWTVGDPAWEGVAASGDQGDSENHWIGGKTVWCVSVASFYGQNTICHFDDFLGYSYKWSLPGGDPRKTAWEALSEIGFINCGAFVYFNGGCVANFSGAQPILQSKQQVASASGYVNSFGKYVCSGTHFETGYLFAASAPSATVQDASTKMLSLENCHGYISSGRAAYLIEGSTSAQEINVANCGFYGNVNALICQATAAKTYIDPKSFRDTSVDFFQTMNINKPMGYSKIMFVNANTSSQALTNTPSTFKPTVLTTCDLGTTPAAACFNTGSGIFTAPTDLRDVDVTVGIQQASGATADEMDFFVYVNGVQTDTRVSYGIRGVVTFNIRRLALNDTVEIKIASFPNRSLSGSATYNYLKINASC